MGGRGSLCSETFYNRYEDFVQMPKYHVQIAWSTTQSGTKAKILTDNPGSVISIRREPKSYLGRVFNSKLGRIAILCGKCMA